MDVLIFGKRTISMMLVMMVIITGCMPSDTPTNKYSASATKAGNSGGSGSGATPVDDVTDNISLPPKVEIRHLIDPNLSYDPNYSTGTGYAGGGTYTRKLTLPKNFAGKLYVAGININTLVDRVVRVRFKFGMNKETVTVPATVVQAPGITPQTPISVLVLDLRSEPFRNVRLPYDLFDYNEYSFDQDPSADTTGMKTTPVQDNRDSGLYCRGLKLEDDPTFTGVGACDGQQSNPDQPAEECLYSYAKVMDQGLIRQSGTVRVPAAPTLPQVMSIAGSNYFQDYFAKQFMKPVGDTMSTTTATSHIFNTFTFTQASAVTGSTNMTFDNTWAGIPFGTSTYFYRGPYRLSDTRNWQFRYTTLDGPRGLFKADSYVNFVETVFTGPAGTCPNSAPSAVAAACLPDDPVYYNYLTGTYVSHARLYYNSLMFPRATQLSIQSNVPHLSHNDPIALRTPATVNPGEKTLWMDGSNARAQSINNENNHVGSCNVSATIELIARDDNLNDYVISSANDVKLQLVRPTQYRTDIGNEVLYTNFKTCSSNTQCGTSECCFNNRCWDNSLVSQCFDDSLINGNRAIGTSCTSDLQCSSLCCNRSTGQCAPHNTSVNPAVLCSKPVGEFCISKEWCQKYPITKRLIVKTVPDASGNMQCTAYDYQALEYGDCKNSICTPPNQPTLTPFDETAPGACTNAVPAPSF